MHIDFTQIWNLLKNPNRKIVVGAFAVSVLVGVPVLVLYFLKRYRLPNFAAQWEGEEEIAENGGFKDTTFDAKMRDVAGFKDFQQWCAYFVRFVVLSKTKESYKPYLEKVLSPSTQLMWKNASTDETGNVSVSDTPERGDIAVWQGRADTSKGHTGIVADVKSDYFVTIEGNVNSYQQGEKFNFLDKIIQPENKTLKSTGIVARMKRSYDGDGMNLLGFIRLDEKLLKIL